MIRNKKQMFVIIGAFILTIVLGTVTFAFFNYTRTGTANNIRTGTINFNTTQSSGENGYITLSNVFPIDVSEGIPSNNSNVGEVVINVIGNTTYGKGLEYKVSAVNVTNTYGSGANQKTIPISIAVTVESNSNNSPATTLGTEEEEYFDRRGSTTSYYRILANETISNNDELLVGYIAPGSTGVDGNIVIKAYLDESKILISDTYPEEETDTNNDGYIDGTPTSMGEGKTIFTTTEWNSFQQDGVSFQVKVESNEGTWVEENRTVNVADFMKYSYETPDHALFSLEIWDERSNIKEVYFNKMGATRMQAAYDASNIKVDLTANNEGKVLAWLETNEQDPTKYNLIIASDGDTYIVEGGSLFSGFSSMTNIYFNNLNTSTLLFAGTMFDGCSSLVSLDLSSFDTSSLYGTPNMFRNCTSLVELDLSSFGSHSLFAPEMFNNCTSLQTIYVSSLWNTTDTSQGIPIFVNNTSLVGTSPNGTTYAFTDYNMADKTYAVIATDDTVGYLTDISLKPTN